MKNKDKIIIFIAVNLISYFICAYMSGKFDLTDIEQQYKIGILITFLIANVIAVAVIQIRSVK